MRHIRHAIVNDILRNMSWLRNRASHLSQGRQNYAVYFKRDVAVAISIWMFNLFFPLMKFWVSLDIKVNKRSIAQNFFLSLPLTFVFPNSSLNPVIYCWKMRHIQHAIMDILRNTYCFRNLASHLSQSQSLPVFLFLNAVIYCWKMRHIPHTIMNIL